VEIAFSSPTFADLGKISSHRTNWRSHKINSALIGALSDALRATVEADALERNVDTQPTDGLDIHPTEIDKVWLPKHL